MTSGLSFHPATGPELERLLRSLVAARVFADEAEARLVHAVDPWRLEVSGRGDVAVVERWREHLDLLAIEALWCRLRAVPEAIDALRLIAEQRGYSGLVSQPTPVDETRTYERAGMRVEQVVAVYQLRRTGAGVMLPRLKGVTLHETDLGGLDTLLALDASCFSPFWRYDARHLERLGAGARFVLAERHGVPVGYTLSNTERRTATLVRLGVAPHAQGLQIGSLLVAEAVRYAFEHGCNQMTLSTQVENRASRAVYERAGFRDTQRRFAFLRCEVSTCASE